MEPKAVEMTIHVDPRHIGGGRSILAEFKLLWEPFRIEGCKLIQTVDGYDVLMPSRAVRINQGGRALVVDAVVKVFEGTKG